MLILRTRSEPVRELVFGASGMSLASATDCNVSLFRIPESGKPRKIDMYCYAEMEFADSDKILLLPEHGALNCVDLATGSVQKVKLVSGRLVRIAVTRDSHRFVIGQHHGYLALRSVTDLTVDIWHQSFDRAWIKRLLIDETRDEIHCIVQNAHPFPTEFWFETLSLSTGAKRRQSNLLSEDCEDEVSLSPDGSWLATFRSKRVSVYPTTKAFKKPSSVLVNSGRQLFTDIAFHPSGRFLAATSNDTTVKLYDTTSWQLARTYSWNIGRLRSIAFSPDGMLAAAGSDTGRIVVWDVEE